MNKRWKRESCTSIVYLYLSNIVFMCALDMFMQNSVTKRSIKLTPRWVVTQTNYIISILDSSVLPAPPPPLPSPPPPPEKNK